MRLTFLIITVSTFLISSCKNNSEHSHDNDHNHDEHVEEGDNHDEHLDHAELKTMELNNGEKWQLQPELMVNIGNMQSIIDSVKLLETKDYEQIANELNTETMSLVKSCTMKGNSHNELHKWLEPHMAMVKDLKATKSADEGEGILAAIDASFDLLLEYFK
jgi:hypothetical protein